MTESEDLKVKYPMSYFVYRVYARTGELLYVGMTYNVYARLLQHRFTSSWWDRTCVVKTEQFSSLEEALAAEGVAIRIERPRWNRTHLSGLSSPFLDRHWRPSEDQATAMKRIEEAATKREHRAAVATALAAGVPVSIIAKLPDSRRNRPV